MPRRMWKTSVLFLAVGCCLATVQPARAQVAVITLKSVDALMSDAKYVAGLAGQGDKAQQFDQLLAVMTGGQGLKGIDTTKPLGAIIMNVDIGGGAPKAALFVPIAKESEFLDFLKAVNVDLSKPDKGVYSFEVPGSGEKVYLKFANKHAFASNDEEVIKGTLPDPATIVTGVHKEALIAATLHADRVSKDAKKQLTDLLSMGIEMASQKQDNETDAQFELRKANMKQAKESLTRIVDETKSISLSVNVDQKKEVLALEFGWAAQAGSKTAEQFKDIGKYKSDFVHLTKDAAAHIVVAQPIDPATRAQFDDQFDQLIKMMKSEAPNPRVAALGEKLIRAVLPTLKSEKIDFGAALRGPLPDGKFVLVGGLRVKEGAKIEQVLREAAKEIPPTDKITLKMDAEKVGGFNLHTLKADADDANLKRVLGEAQIVIAVRDDAIFFAFGGNAVEAVKDGIAGLGKGVAGTQPAALQVSVARIAPILDKEQEDQAKFINAVGKIFTGANRDRDKIRVHLEGGDAYRVRIEADAALIKLFAALIPTDN